MSATAQHAHVARAGPRPAMSGLLSRLTRWAHAKALGFVKRAVIAVLAAGPVPQHVAFVMDGNRRYARRTGKPVFVGHSDGFVALERVLEICIRLNIRCVSVYAFSIENFKRAPDEVDALMTLAEDKLRRLAKEGSLLSRYGVRLNVLGRTDLLPLGVQAAVREAETMTRTHDRAILNLCMPYTATDEIAQAVSKTVREAVVDDLDPDHIDEHTVASHLMTSPVTSGTPPLDILIRTSGVKRLSDFLLWQCHEDTQLQFSETYWPDFGLRELALFLLDYQRKVWGRRAARSPAVRKDDVPRLWDDQADIILRARARER